MNEHVEPSSTDVSTGAKVGTVFKGKLKNRLIAWFLVVSLIPLVLTSTFVYSTASSSLIEKQNDAYVSLVKSRAEMMDQYFKERMNEIRIIATTSDIRTDDNVHMMKFIQSLKQTAPQYDGNTFIGLDGHVKADTFENSVGINLGMRPFFKNAMEGKESYTDVILAKTTGQRSIIVAVPVKSPDGKVKGALTGLVNFEKFTTEIFKSLYIDNGVGYPIVVDNQGKIQLHPNKELIGKTAEEAKLTAGLVNILGQEKSDATSYSYSEAGENFTVAYAPVPTTGYSIYMHIPEDSITAAVSSIQWSVMVIVIAVSLIVVILAYFIAQQITRPIVAVAEAAERVSNGDLNQEELAVKSSDEVGKLTGAVNTMIRSLRQFIQQVNRTAEDVATSAEELSANADHTSKATEHIAMSIQEVADGTEQQVQNVEESVRSIHQVAEGVQQISNNAQSVAHSALSASESAEMGNRILQTVMQQMQSIHDTVNTLNDTVKQLGQRSAAIDNIVQVISGIAAQTNLLALNAAIEAARAGEHGRGFAVVADEVRKLSEQSGESTEKIAGLLASIQSETATAIESMEQGTREVAVGMDVVNQAGVAFTEILNSVQQVATQIQEVTAYSIQMNSNTEHAVEQVNLITEVAERSAEGTQNVSAATEEQLAAMEQVSSSATSLAKMAEDLQSYLSKFKV
ncbi:methyl-accepting chemotaxis protein [Paenibacillus sp. SC116]|uniref:methyl-accepting chemotaxis protein n=1 Tax=Paenibacillus sp. SC116 TaxID=2968986 RepID=UPI00215A7CD4|nr:methyl-accepting chemotaxis protein [Paenibacillus sp. SC116]MCR8845107.1 methyl-accepting chemotaxis protein [Paenibacillus sp. SC116]